MLDSRRIRCFSGNRILDPRYFLPPKRFCWILCEFPVVKRTVSVFRYELLVPLFLHLLREQRQQQQEQNGAIAQLLDWGW